LQLLSYVFSLTQELGRNNITKPVVSISGTVINLQKWSLKKPLATLLVEEAGRIIFVFCLAVSKQNTWFIPL